MDSAWVRLLLRLVNRKKKLFEVPGYRQSRRVDGLFDRDDEYYGFKNICIYVDDSLVGKEKQIAEILSCIDNHVYSYEHYCHTRWLMFFGSNPDKLNAPGPSRVHHAIPATNWEGTLKKFIATRTNNSPVVIPCTHNPGSILTRSPDRYDLGLFFCSDKEMYVRKIDDQARFRMIGAQCIWFFLGDEETPQIETGTFVPQVIADCNMPQ